MDLFLVGAGHVGLVTAVGFARLGHHVTVADIDEGRIRGLQAGEPPIFEPGLREGIAEQQARLAFTIELDPPPAARYSFVAVNTPTDASGPLAMTHVLAVAARLLGRVGADHTIVIRSTLPLAGPEQLVELRASHAGTAAIVTNPEFMREGSGLRDFEKPGRILAGWLEERDQPAAVAMLGLYAAIAAPTLVADARSVALVKLASNVFLAMKVAYANELARLADAFGADAKLVADGVGLDERIGRAFLDSGPGFGGSCLPEQAIALSEIAARASVPTPLVDAVKTSNRTHQAAIVDRLGALLGGAPGEERAALRDRRVALLGLSFKANTDDVRESPALAIATELRAAGAHVVATDPAAARRAALADPTLEIAPSPEAATCAADAAIVVTEWPAYASLDWAALAAGMAGDVVFDTRRIVDAEAVEAAGLRLVTLGRR
jgi:UDPglucose 6-dehydrogenase